MISSLREVFSDFGCPEAVISNNGPQFRCNKFATFCEHWRIEHYTSSTLHHAKNDQVEHCGGTVEAMIQKCGAEGKDWRKALLSLRSTPVDQNLPSPSQLLQGSVLRDNIPVETLILNTDFYLLLLLHGAI